MPTGDEAECPDQCHVVEELRHVAGRTVEQHAARALGDDDRGQRVDGPRQPMAGDLNRQDHTGHDVGERTPAH